MSPHLLLTSFTTWLPHQTSNSADDLVGRISDSTRFEQHVRMSLTFLRHLPVKAPIASQCVIDTIDEIEPSAIICCGMAESRQQLTIESNATCGDLCVRSPVNLEPLIVNTQVKISHDAGKFVCEALYFSVLRHLLDKQLNSPCIFVHVPILTTANLQTITNDFRLILQKMALL